MRETIEFGIGFVTGRANVCEIINSYYRNMIEQIEKFNKKVNITIFILYDIKYQSTKEEEFYNINPCVYESSINIKYITYDIIKKEKEELISKGIINNDEAEVFFGYGHAKGRNSLMYFAKKFKINYLLFWDDDEYPIANIKNKDGSIEWKLQDNLLVHLNNIEYADVTSGYHCGYISPIPYVDYTNEISEESFRDYIESVSNDIISWKSIKTKFEKDNGVTYANKNIVNDGKINEVKMRLGGKWIAGSTLCLNLNNIENIPAFYNPPGARGEDTFFATKLNNSKVIKVPVYHFHDGFLKYKEIMKSEYPCKLDKISYNNEDIEKRFFKASIGWIKYKSLLIYITKNKEYKQISELIERKLLNSIPSMNKLFNNTDFYHILKQFKIYNNHVGKHYKEYLKTNRIWNKIKYIH